MLKNQLTHLQNESFTIPESQRSRLRWCGSRASGQHILHISQKPGILSIINQDPQLDVVNIFASEDSVVLTHPLSKDCVSTFWSGDLKREIPFPMNYFDAIITEDTLIEVMSSQNNEVQRLLKPNGKIIVTETLEHAEELRNEWETLFHNFEEIDMRIDEHYVSWVGRNVVNPPTDYREAGRAFLEEIRKVIVKKKAKRAALLQKELETKRNEEVVRLEEKNKLLMKLPIIKKKHETRINQIQLTSDEKKNLLQEPEETIVKPNKMRPEEQLAHFSTLGKMTIVYWDSEVYRKNSLTLAHQLVDTLRNRGKNVVYVYEEENEVITPIHLDGSRFLQISTSEFWRSLHLFEEPEMYITHSDLQISKRIGRLQWKKWSIFYLPEKIVDRDAHLFLMNSLDPSHFLVSMGRMHPIKLREENSVVNTLTNESSRIVIGFVGDLGKDCIDYQAMKDLLVENKGLGIELIGYNLPDSKPINSKRLTIREYANDVDLMKRVGRWTGGILPFRYSASTSALVKMESLGIPIFHIKEWSAPLEDQEFISYGSGEKVSVLLEEAVLHLEGRNDR